MTTACPASPKKTARKKRSPTKKKAAKKSPKRSPRKQCTSPRDKLQTIAFHSKKVKCPLCTKAQKCVQTVSVKGHYVNKGNRWYIVGKADCGHKIHQFTKAPVSTKCSGS